MILLILSYQTAFLIHRSQRTLQWRVNTCVLILQMGKLMPRVYIICPQISTVVAELRIKSTTPAKYGQGNNSLNNKYVAEASKMFSKTFLAITFSPCIHTAESLYRVNDTFCSVLIPKLKVLYIYCIYLVTCVLMAVFKKKRSFFPLLQRINKCSSNLEN